ncbi:YajG family lipoprotein [Aeromonas sp. MR7]|uniref:YajG family lipoprotein n=1 Tax=Aeromonas sp. MR7 TaxID=2923419 RepID=UPI001F4AF2DD|nr:YajG family lipoprotein [Aeromonas sp. MR7]MCH7346059.1 YajG family lipoprotein [Aeromonas sp. MR7]
MKKSLLLLAALTLGGCATHWPETALLNPQVIPSNQQYYSGNRITLEGVDKREAAYVFSIKKKEKAAVLVNSEQPLNNLLAEKLAEGLRSQGLEVGNSGTTNLTLAISSASVTVEEKTFTYVTKSRVSLQVMADFQGSKLTKQFNMSSSKEGPGEPTMAELESILNQQLGSLLQQIMADNALRGYLKGQPS